MQPGFIFPVINRSKSPDFFAAEKKSYHLRESLKVNSYYMALDISFAKTLYLLSMAGLFCFCPELSP
jgi:hypothetical protein